MCGSGGARSEVQWSFSALAALIEKEVSKWEPTRFQWTHLPLSRLPIIWRAGDLLMAGRLGQPNYPSTAVRLRHNGSMIFLNNQIVAYITRSPISLPILQDGGQDATSSGKTCARITCVM